jgi:hypothetical protein
MITGREHKQYEERLEQTLGAQHIERKLLDEQFSQQEVLLEEIRQAAQLQRQEDDYHLQIALYDRDNLANVARQEKALRTVLEHQREAQDRLEQELKKRLAQLEEEQHKERR